MTLIKFKQERAEAQLALWHDLKMFSTSLKFVDYLQENRLSGVPQDLYNTILRQKLFYNFIIKKRFFVCRDIIT